jgi:hypothetical protein
MASMIYLSLDSVLAGAALCLFGLPRRYWLFASSAIGFADGFALLCGWTLRNSIVTTVTPLHQGVLFVGPTLVATIISKKCANRPRLLIAATAFLFSIDNLLAGAQLMSIKSAAQNVLTAAIFSASACFAGLCVAEPIKSRVRPQAWFALASAVAGIRFLVPN